MIVLDANILIRAVLGKRVRQLLETYAVHGIRFYAPEVAYTDAEKYLPALLAKRGKLNLFRTECAARQGVKLDAYQTRRALRGVVSFLRTREGRLHKSSSLPDIEKLE